MFEIQNICKTFLVSFIGIAVQDIFLKIKWQNIFYLEEIIISLSFCKVLPRIAKLSLYDKIRKAFSQVATLIEQIFSLQSGSF